jgi:polygalacturonase
MAAIQRTEKSNSSASKTIAGFGARPYNKKQPGARDMTTDIGEFGGKGDGHTDNSAAFAAAFSALKREGGGTLKVGRGIYLTGPIELFDNTTLQIEEGAALQFFPDVWRYPPVRTRWEGVVCFGMHPLIFAREAHNIALTGRGTIDGSGEPWWTSLRLKKNLHQSAPVEPIEITLARYNKYLIDQPSGGGGREMQFLRPPLFQCFRCSNVHIEGLTFRNSPFWTIHPVFSDHVTILDVFVQNPPDAPNTDGIDIDSCTDVSIARTTVDVGDDCITIKAGAGEPGLREGAPSKGIIIHHCLFRRGHGGIVIGSETAGGVSDVSVHDCHFEGTDRGIRIKTRRGRGGLVEKLRFNNLTMEKVICPIAINMYYRCGAASDKKAELFSLAPMPVDALTPHFRDIEISGVDAQHCRASAGFIVGLPEAPIERLTMQHCNIGLADHDTVPVSEAEMFEGLPEISVRGVRIRHASCGFHDVTVTGLDTGAESFIFEDGAKTDTL